MELALLSQSLLFWVVVTSTLYTLHGIIYRLYLSPISSFPGPKLAAVTFWYEFYHDIVHRGQYIWKVQELHKRYGPVVRINPYELHISDPEFWDELYSNDKKADKWKWNTKQFGIGWSILATADHDTHKMRRSALNGFFSMQRSRTLQPVIQERVVALVTRFEEYKGSGNVIQLENAYAAMANDVVMEYNFSRHEHRIEAPDFDPTWFQQNHAGATLTPLLRHFNFIIRGVRSLPDSLAMRLNPALSALIFLRRGMGKQIEAIRSGHDTAHTSSSHSTVFHDILSSKLPEHEKTTERLADEAQLLIAAGTETTSWTLTVATFHLLANPSILRKVKEELRSVDQNAEGHKTVAILQSLPYLTATINEALRLTNGVTHRLQRVFHEPLIYKPSSLTLSSILRPTKEFLIPPGTPVSMSTVDLHLNSDIFPSPHSFRPERWIENPSLTKYQMAFSKGTRRCIGMNLAYAELYTCLAAVFVKFGSKEVRMDGDAGVLELVETTEEDVRLWGDCFLPVQKPGSLGVRAIVRT